MSRVTRYSSVRVSLGKGGSGLERENRGCECGTDRWRPGKPSSTTVSLPAVRVKDLQPLVEGVSPPRDPIVIRVALAKVFRIYIIQELAELRYLFLRTLWLALRVRFKTGRLQHFN